MMRRLVLGTIVGLVVAGAAAAQQYSGNGMRLQTKTPTYESSLRDMQHIPPLADMSNYATAEELSTRAEARAYRRQIRLILYRYLGKKKKEEIRQDGITRLREFTDPAAFIPLIEETRDEQDDVRLAVLEHFSDHGEWGQAALVWITIHERDEAMHYEALKRLTKPASPPVLNVIDAGLRSHNDFVANLSGVVAGHLDIFDTIPLLIHGQSRTRTVREPGDDAWILVGSQQVFIRALIPIVGDNSGAFLPVPGVLTDGVILRVVEAVVVIYRTEVHQTLVGITSRDWGQSTAHLGYDFEKWREWYEHEYVPYKREQALMARMIEEKPTKDQHKGNQGGG